MTWNSLNNVILEIAEAYSSGDYQDPLLYSRLVEKIEKIRPLGISFSDFHHSLDANQAIDFTGKRVIEIGGSLSPQWVFNTLKVEYWQAIEHSGYEDEVGQLYSTIDGYKANNGRPSESHSNYNYTDSGLDSFFCDFCEQKMEPYDGAYSVACFEHLNDLSSSLGLIANMLKTDATLYAYFSPIWSAPHELHCPPPKGLQVHDYFHLVNDYDSAFRYLDKQPGWSRIEIENYLHLLFKSPHINRMHFEDYESIFASCSLKVMSLIPLNCVRLKVLEPSLSCAIQKNYPHITKLATGIRVILKKL